jgi:arylsulfatase A
MEIMDESEVTIAEIFKANGYRTGIFGKWHNGQHMPNHPLGKGFEEFFGF